MLRRETFAHRVLLDIASRSRYIVRRVQVHRPTMVGPGGVILEVTVCSEKSSGFRLYVAYNSPDITRRSVEHNVYMVS